MSLNWIVILGIIITNAQLITLSSRNLCSCNQLLDNISCLSAEALCVWSNDICTSKECSEISNKDCPQTFACYLLNGETCTEFVECNQLNGNSIKDCYSQNNQCSWTSDSNCVPLNQVTCEEVTEQDYCIQSGNTLCYWSQDKCNSMKVCSEQTIEKDCVNNSLKACQWDSEKADCIDSSCSLQSADQCSSFLLSSINTGQFQICHIVSSVCTEANPQDLSQEDCYTNSKGTYFWDSTGKQCSSCASAKNIVEQIESTCRCSQILSEVDCNQKCRWMDTYCKDRWCRDNLTQADCDNDSNCFYQDNLCQVYKGCNELKQELCESDTYHDSCKWDTDCQPVEEPAPIICVDFKTEADCNLAVETNSGKFCIWIVSSNECKGAVASNCSAVNDVDNIEDLCGRLTDLCFYNTDEGACEQLVCGHYEDAENCTDHQWTIVDESGNLNLCSWNGTHCISGIDIEQFDQTNCYSEDTRFQLTFDATSKKCTKCPGIGGDNKRKDYLPDHLEVQKSICSTPILSEQEQFEPQNIQPLQFLYISPNLITPLWPPIKEKLLQITNMSNITPYQLYQQIEDIYLLHFQAKNLKSKINFNNLQEAISNFEFKRDLLQKGIPHFAKLALRLESEFRDYIPMLTDTFTLTHEQCAILIANMFFCTLHLQPDFKHLPSTFICAKLFNHNNDDNGLKIQKIRCFLYYIMHVFENKNNTTGNVVFTRQRRDFNLLDVKLCEFIYCENGNMEQVEDAHIVDFANKRIGGGVLSAGCVQEEILFLSHPEAMVSVLLTTEIQGDEAILIEGVERIIDYSGYKNTFKCDGLVKRKKIINFICIDAQDYATNRHQQYNDYQSQVIKAYTGFYGKQRICTGRWGCGVFGGEWQLKTLIQWLAASCCGCKQLIFVNDQNYIFNQAFQLIGNMSTLQLMKYIKEYCQLKVNDAIDLKAEAIDYILLSNKN